MAYQTRHRDPLLETHIQEAIQKRGKELLGLLLFGLGIATALILGSYIPEDPSWFSATDAPVHNILGRFGASIASPLFVTIGWAAWGIAALALTWGARFFLHAGDKRFFGRIIFSPIAIAVLSVFASTHAPSFGLGGLFGDTTLAALLAATPLDLPSSLKFISFLSGLALLATLVFVTGFNADEIRTSGRFLLIGVIMSYASIVAILTWAFRRAAGALTHLVRAVRTRQTERAVSSRARAKGRDETAKPTRNLFVRRRPLFSDPKPRTERPAPIGQTPEERIHSRIVDVIHNRKLTTEPDLATRQGEPPLSAPASETGEEKQTPPFRSGRGPYIPPTPESRAVIQHRTHRKPRVSRKAKSESQPALTFDGNREAYEDPPLGLLANPITIERHSLSDEALAENARMLENVLEEYGVRGEITSVSPGPVVTMYELEPAPGLKASRVIGLADDIARSMSALSARVSTIPGRTIIGIELPNAHREKVMLREILSNRTFGDSPMKLPLALGKDIAGDAVVANLAKMPHLLIAGTTGSGKSVAINTMILSLLYRLSPDECRMIMIDPKMLELSVYDGIPHLLSPVVTDPKKAVVALKWVVSEMEERYRKMSRMGVRNIDGYNGRVKDALDKGENFSRTVQTGFDDATGDPVFETEEFKPESMPFIVVVVDEMADLMMVAGKEIEACIQRLAQMARASGIHIIMATQRPSVDVITGTIKANFPTRISFQVTSKVDSRTILGEMGAEQLLGMGDMLYMEGGGRITRVHGPFVSDEEVEEIVNHLKSFGAPDYVSGVVDGPDNDATSEIDQVLGLGGNTTGENALYDQAVAIVLQDRKCSTSYIQRKLAIGYNKAARLVEQMEDSGLVSAANRVGKREILVPEGT
ncbi:MAG: DNA translocase FtsK [Paracoccaceae bacterium]